MNRQIIAAVMSCIIIFLGTFGLFNTYQIKEKMCQELETAEKAALSGDITKAEEAAEQARAFWKSKESRLFLYIRHDELDEIEKSISELKYLAKLGDTAEFCSKANQSLALVEHIWECELPVFKNIL